MHAQLLKFLDPLSEVVASPLTEHLVVEQEVLYGSLELDLALPCVLKVELASVEKPVTISLVALKSVKYC